ncbi:MAG TPA: MFS transporter [Verrucomicrobiales bacterium]|nr:MFS transporter [Verrucomicrobiales bacterium]
MSPADSLPAAAAPSLSVERPAAAWSNVVLAALLMLATLPGRTQGMGLITEPLLRELQLDRVLYANINLWATLLGAAFCLPAGWLIDRFGLRWTSAGIVLLLAAAVWGLSAMQGALFLLFALVLLTRALGQSALSVASITAVGKSFGGRVGWAMGVYSVLLSVFFAGAFVAVGAVVRNQGWRPAWALVALGLVLVAALVVILFHEPLRPTQTRTAPPTGLPLSAALRTRLFWVFAGATALFGLASSGIGLFNEAILAERGFDQQTFHTFLAVSTLCALAGQMLCGWLSRSRPMPRLLAMAMFLYAGGLAALPNLHTHTQLWIFAAVFGVAAGFIAVIFFAAWRQTFGRAHLGRIQGAAQMLTVLASALGPLLFAQCHAAAGSYAPLLYTLAPILFGAGFIAWRIKPVPPRCLA